VVSEYSEILYIHEYRWKNMVPDETIPGMGRGEIKENDRGGELKYDMIYILLEFL
jgi:hypothetical protein